MNGIRVGLDLRYLSTISANRGIAEYMRMLSRELVQMSGKYSYYCYIGSQHEPPELASKDSIVRRVKILPMPRRYYNWGGRWLLGRAIKRDRLDIIHFPEFRCYWHSNSIKTVVTVLDLIPLIYRKQYWTFRYLEYFPYYLYKLRQIKRADVVITISEASKNDIAKYLGIDPIRIAVTPLAAKPIFRPLDKEKRYEVIAKYGLQKKEYFIYVGGFDFRKNIPFLLKAFDQFRIRNRGKLFLAGYVDSIHDKLLSDSIAALKHRDDIVVGGYMTDKELVCLMNNAVGMIFPSLYEGFGLPVVEAIHCKIPVVAYASSAAKEILQDSPGLFANLDIHELAEKIEKLVNDRKFSDEILSAQANRIGYYSWKNTAKATIDVYDRLIVG